GLDDCRELLRRVAYWLQRRRQETLLDVREGERLDGLGLQPLHDLRCDGSRSQQSQPLRGVEALVAPLVQGRELRHGREAFQRRESQYSYAPRLVMRNERRGADHANRNLAADEIDDRLAAALVGHADHVDAGELLQELARHVLA